MTLSNAEKQQAYRHRNLYRMKEMQKAVGAVLNRCDELMNEIEDLKFLVLETNSLLDSVRDYLIKS